MLLNTFAVDGREAKSGKKIPGDFAGSPKKATINFVTPYSSVAYAVAFDPVSSSGVIFTPNAENKTINGFDINLGTGNIADLVEILWQASLIAE